MHPIDDLTSEHAAVKLMLRVLEKMNERISRLQPVPDADLKNSLAFLQEFADKCHHRKEEKYLFPVIKAAGRPEERELIELLLADHAQGRNYLSNMAAAFESKAENEARFAEIFLLNSRSYVLLLDRHIDRENNVLFPIARRSLSVEELQDLDDGFDSIEEHHAIGAGRHAELHRIIEGLRDSYL